MEFFIYGIVSCIISYIAWKEINENRKQQQLEERLESERLKKEKEKQILEIQEKEARRLERKRLKKEKIEKIKLKKLEQEKKERFYKECLEKNLFKIESDENKKNLLELAKKNELKEDIEQLIQQMYYVEKSKDIIFSNYFFIKYIKQIIKMNGIYEFVCLVGELRCNENLSKSNNSTVDLLLEMNENNPQKLLEYIVYYNKLLNIIKNDEELNTICNNLLKSNIKNKYIDYKYISKKIYDIYNSHYREKYKIKITQNDFSNIFVLIKYEKNNNGKYSEFYKLISQDYKRAIDFPKTVYEKLVLHKRKLAFYEDISYYYILDKKNELSFYEICKLLLDMDEMWTRYFNIVNKEKEKIEKIKEKEKELSIKKEIEQERVRLLKGDISKEAKINDTIKENKIKQKGIEIGYQNVKDGYEFEEYVANLYKELGYKIEEVTKKSGDQGADVIAYKNNIKYVIQVKFYNNPVGNKAVQEVVGAKGMYKADKGIVITNSTFTQSAIELAKANNIELVNGEKIEEYKKIIIDNI